MIISEYDALQSYDQMLDEVYPELFIGHSSFLASTVLKELDPIAYRVGFGEYVDSLAEDGEFVEGWTDVPEDHFDESMDGDHDSAMASAGFGTDEDYGSFGNEE
jgi:hypothetical protein